MFRIAFRTTFRILILDFKVPLRERKNYRPRHPIGWWFAAVAVQVVCLHAASFVIDMTKNDTISGIEPRLEGLDARLKVVSGQQANILSALGMILDTLRAQTKMLQQLTALARDEPASSPLVESLDDLTGAILAMDGSLQAMAGQLDGLPKAITAELARQERPR